jgi:hypothetical protein
MLHYIIVMLSVALLSVFWLIAMFLKRKVCYSALFTNLVRWHAGAVSFPPSDVILAQLACPLSDVMFCIHSGSTNLSLYKHWLIVYLSGICRGVTYMLIVDIRVEGETGVDLANVIRLFCLVTDAGVK